MCVAATLRFFPQNAVFMPPGWILFQFQRLSCEVIGNRVETQLIWANSTGVVVLR